MRRCPHSSQIDAAAARGPQILALVAICKSLTVAAGSATASWTLTPAPVFTAFHAFNRNGPLCPARTFTRHPQCSTYDRQCDPSRIDRTATFLACSFTLAACLCVKRTAMAKQRGRESRISVAADDTGSVSDVGVVLLSAGVGKRMGASIPKQYLKLSGLEIALHSLNVFLECNVAEIVIVCAEEWQYIFQEHLDGRREQAKDRPVIKFTSGGAERQDSVSNGLAKITSEYVAVHDAARPLVTLEEVEKVIEDAHQHGAALLAVPTKATIKQTSSRGDSLVSATPDRKTLWEAHTPQVIRADLLRDGFKHAVENNLDVTDDVSLVEKLGKPVKLTEGEYTNIKVTTPEDIAVGEAILQNRGFVAPSA